MLLGYILLLTAFVSCEPILLGLFLLYQENSTELGWPNNLANRPIEPIISYFCKCIEY